MADLDAIRQSREKLEASTVESRQRTKAATGVTAADLAVAGLNEMVKSYGVRVDREKGFSWSADNIVESFRESPVWTTVDWLTLAVPVTKWGLAINAVSSGARAVAAGGKASTLAGAALAAERAAGKGGLKTTLTAAKSYLNSPHARTGVGRFLESSMGKTIDEKSAIALYDKLDDGAKAFVSKGLGNQILREKKAYEAAMKGRAQDMIEGVGRFAADPESRKLMDAAMREKYGSTEFARMMGKLTPEQQSIVMQFNPWRNEINREVGEIMGWTAGRIAATDGQYVPHIYMDFAEEMFGKIDPESLGGVAVVSGKAAERAGAKRLLPRTIAGNTQDEWVAAVKDFNDATGYSLQALFDPRYSIAEMAKVSSVVASHRYVKKLSQMKGLVEKADDLPDALKDTWVTLESLLPVSTQEVKSAQLTFAKEELSRARKVIDSPGPVIKALQSTYSSFEEAQFGKAALLRNHFDDAKIIGNVEDGYKVVSKKAGGVAGREVSDRLAAAELRFGRALNSNLHGAYRTLPNEWKDLRVDPLIAEDIKESLKLQQLDKHPITAFVRSLTQFFNLSKTAYNPTAHIRNPISNIVFNSFSTGRLQPVPTAGIRAFWKAGKGEKAAIDLVTEARGLNVLGHTFERETMQELTQAMAEMTGRADEIGGYIERTMPRVAALAAKSRKAYSYEDDVWKLHAYIVNRSKYLKAGLAPDLAKSKAALDVQKYFPMYGDVSPMTAYVRQYVPFASFTMESLRVWKNVMTFKPWWAVAWENSAQMASKVAQVHLGVSDEQMEAAESSMPEWVKGKKVMLLPWKDKQGQLQFLDQSPYLPLADLAGEAELMQGSFIGLPPRLNPLAGFGFAQHPVVSTAIAATLQVDPFTQQKTEPTFTDKALQAGGISPPGPGVARRTLGLAEHIAKTLLPPFVPPGYAGVNLLELASQEVDPKTGERFEPDVTKTVAANLLGLRAITPDEKGARSREYAKKERETEQKKVGWARFDHAIANEDLDRARVEREKLIKMYGSVAKFNKAGERRKAAQKYRGLSKKAHAKAKATAAKAGSVPVKTAPTAMQGLNALRSRTLSQVPALQGANP